MSITEWNYRTLKLDQVVYLRTPLKDGNFRLAPVFVYSVASNGGTVYKHPPVGILEFNINGEIFYKGTDKLTNNILVLPTEDIDFNSPDKIVDKDGNELEWYL